jgi:hypothetical protein
LGKAASVLVRRGVEMPVPTKMVNGLVVFDPPPDSPEVSTEKVKDLEAEW